MHYRIAFAYRPVYASSTTFFTLLCNFEFGRFDIVFDNVSCLFNGVEIKQATFFGLTCRAFYLDQAKTDYLAYDLTFGWKSGQTIFIKFC